MTFAYSIDSFCEITKHKNERREKWNRQYERRKKWNKVLSKAQEIANAIARMRTKSIKCIMGAMHVPYRIGLAEGKATEHENYMEMYVPKTFVAAFSALFEQRTIEFTD